MIKYPFLQKRAEGMWSEEEEERETERSKRAEERPERSGIKKLCLPGITGKYFTISWTSDTVALICKIKKYASQPK